MVAYWTPIAAGLLMGAASCAEPSLADAGENAVNNAACDVTIQFGSFATGIDGAAAAAVARLIEVDPSVLGVTRSRLGPEGEYALCVRTQSREQAATLFERLRAALDRPVRAPVTVAGPQGSFSAPLARR